MARTLDIAIIGAGFSGIGVAIALKRAGSPHRFTIYERAERLGGTWWFNTYPGAACDVQSNLYSYSFAPNPDWSRRFAPQAEILAYLERVADEWGLRPHIRFGVGVASARFVAEGAGRWVLTTEAGAQFEADAVVVGAGGLNVPSYPSIPGLKTFAGPVMHTARWDHAVPLAGQRVGVIGTGASAVQVVPAIAPEVAHLSLFQRTPHWILPRPDGPNGALRRGLFRRLPVSQWLDRQRLYWQLEGRVLGFVYQRGIMRVVEWLARRHLARAVPDATRRAALTPDFTIGCKRILLSNDYYPAVSRSDVDLVTAGIEAITPAGVRTVDGVEHALDVLVLATGFRTAEQAIPFEITGQGGQTLAGAWAEGAVAYKGTTVAGFPNLFLMTGPNTGLGHTSVVFIIESQLPYVLGGLDRLAAGQPVAVRAEAQAEWNAWLQRSMGRTVWASGCQSWYQTTGGRNTVLWPGFTWDFRRRLRRFDAEAYSAQITESV